MKKQKTTRKRPLGSKTISVRLPAHQFLVRVANAEHLNIYEALEKIERHYAVSFYPELLKCLNEQPASKPSRASASM